MNGNPRLKWLLGALLLVAALTLWMRQTPATSGPTAAKIPRAGDLEEEGARPAGPAPAAAAQTESSEPLELDVEALERVPPGYRVGRDPWRFVEAPPPQPPPPHVPTADELRRMREAQEAAERARLAALEQQRAEAAKPKPPELAYTCIGTLGPKSRRIFILASEDGKRILNVEQGDVIDGKFIIARAGLESLEIKFVGFPDWPSKILPVPVSR